MNSSEYQENFSFDISNIEDEDFYKNDDLSGISQRPGEQIPL